MKSKTSELVSDCVAQLKRKYVDEVKKQPKANILILGYTGCGKTSLIQSFFGKSVVSDDKICHGQPGTKGFIEYANDFLGVWDSQGFEPGQGEEEFADAARNLIRKQQDAAPQDIDRHVHLVWYCIQGSAARITDCDINLIKEILKHVVVVITKADLTNKVQADSMIQRLTSAGIPRERIVKCSVVNDVIRDGIWDNVRESAESNATPGEIDRAAKNEIARAESVSARHLKALLDVSMQVMPDAYRNAFVRAQIVDVERREATAKGIIHAASLAAAAAGAVPIPGPDAAIITPIQVGMIAALAALYGVQRDALDVALLPLVAEAAGVLTASSLTKLIPVLGSTLQAGIAAGLTEGLGHYVNHYLKSCAIARAKGNEVPAPSFSLNELRPFVQRLVAKPGSEPRLTGAEQP